MQHPRRATWLELICDIVVVAGIAQSAAVVWRTEPGQLPLPFAAFAAIWWTWLSTTLLVNTGERHRPHRFVTAVTMVGIATMAICSGSPQGPRVLPFAIALITARLIITVGWWRRLLPGPRWRPVAIGLASVAPYVAAATLPAPARMYGWLGAIAIDMLITCRAAHHRRWHLEHLRERLSVFVIIALGECAIRIVHAGSAVAWDARVAAVAAAITVSVGALCYVVMGPIARHPAPMDTPARAARLLTAHFLTTAGLTVLASGFGTLIETASSGHLESPWPWLLGGGAALVLVAGLLTRDLVRPTAPGLLFGALPPLALVLGIPLFDDSSPEVAAVVIVAAMVWHALSRSRLQPDHREHSASTVAPTRVTLTGARHRSAEP